jgi:multidrug resistance efflux pump
MRRTRKEDEEEMGDEELTLLEEQLAVANADIAGLQDRLAEAEALAATRAAEATDLRGQVGRLEAELAAIRESAGPNQAELDDLRARLEKAEGRARDASSRYRDMLLQAEPDLPVDLVTGDTIAEIDGSVQQARATVARIRQRLEEQAPTLRVPPGAPARAGPDLSSLSAAEKIRLGLQDR